MRQVHRNQNRSFRLFWTAVVALSAAGCGYSLRNLRPDLEGQQNAAAPEAAQAAAEAVSGEALPAVGVGKATEEDIEIGRRIFRKSCAFCHGPEGRGDGVVAAFLEPKPRDLTLGLYKFRSTISGEPPTDDDILLTLSRGIHGTEMPRWSDMPYADRRRVVQYVKSLSDVFEEGYEPEMVEIGPQVPETPQSLQRGRTVYMEAKCWECHGEGGEGDGPNADKLKDDWGNKIVPRNLLVGANYGRGSRPIDIYVTLASGLQGTPMPSYAGSLTNEQLWDLANYVSSLAARGD